MKVARAGWTSGSFVLYAGALIALVAASSWLAIISGDNSSGDFAGWSVLFWAIAEIVALALLRRGRRLAGGLAAFVGLGLWAVMVGALFSWWGWLSHGPISGGWHWGDYGFELLVLAAAIVGLRVWRHPLLVAIAAPFSWLFVADFVSSGGNGTAAVSLVWGLVLFAVGAGLDGGDSRPFGFWVHVTAGLTVGGAFLYWWHSSDADWAGIIVVGLVFVFVGAALRRSSYGVLGVLGLVLATGYYSISAFATSVVQQIPGIGGGEPAAGPADISKWQVPVAYICLGAFLALLGMLLFGRRDEQPAASA